MKINDVLADGAATELGELALGQNVVVAYMAWEGGNYEDAILLSERLVHTIATLPFILKIIQLMCVIQSSGLKL